MMMCGVWMVVVGLWALVGVYGKHLLSMLLSFELAMLGLILNLLGGGVFESEYYFILYFFTFAVCEGVLGLVVVISFIRSHGSGFVSGLSMVGC